MEMKNVLILKQNIRREKVRADIIILECIYIKLIYDVIKKMQEGKASEENVILCMNEENACRLDTPSDQNKLVFESLKSKPRLLCSNDPCWLYLRWTIFLFIWLTWFVSWMVRT